MSKGTVKFFNESKGFGFVITSYSIHYTKLYEIKPEMCTKCSLFEPSSLMNPKPLDSLKNFTVPLLIA